MFQISFALIGRFSLVYIQWRLSEQFSGSQAAFETTFLSHMRLSESRIMLPELGHWFFTEVNFIEASKSFSLNFLHKKTAKSCENHQSSFKKYCLEF